MLLRRSTILSLIIFTNNLAFIYSALWYSTNNSIIGVYDRSVTVSFITNFTADDNRAAKSCFVEISNTQIAGGLEEDFKESSRVPGTFKERFNASYNSQLKSYNLNIYNLKFEDVYTFTAVLVYTINNNNLLPKASELNTTLQVKGGPIDCQQTHKNSVNFTTRNTTNSISIIICANPLPNLDWYLNGTVISKNFSTLQISQLYYYNYTLSFPTVYASMCGQTLSYLATGYGLDLRGRSTIALEFDPPPVQTAKSYSIGLCTNIKWLPVDIGKCTGLQYQIEYLPSFNNTTTVYNVSMATAKHSICVNDTAAHNVTSFRVRSIYKGLVGNWSHENINFQYIPPTTDTTTIGTMVTGSALNSNDDNELLIIGVTVGAAVLLLLFIFICVLLACYRQKKKKKENELQNHSIHAYDHCPNHNHGKKSKTNHAKENKLNGANQNNNEVIMPNVDDKNINVEIGSGNYPVNDHHNPTFSAPIATKDYDDDVGGINYFDPEEFGIETPKVEKTPASMRFEDEYSENEAATTNVAYTSDEYDSDLDFHPTYGQRV